MCYQQTAYTNTIAPSPQP